MYLGFINFSMAGSLKQSDGCLKTLKGYHKNSIFVNFIIVDFLGFNSHGSENGFRKVFYEC